MPRQVLATAQPDQPTAAPSFRLPRWLPLCGAVSLLAACQPSARELHYRTRAEAVIPSPGSHARTLAAETRISTLAAEHRRATDARATVTAFAPEGEKPR